jgi:deoxyribodipyrimidine photo-lyase
LPDRQRIIWWLRRDLRLHDNVALAQALAARAAVVPVFVLDPRLLDGLALAPAQRAFLFDALGDLDSRLRKRGSYLVVRWGDPAQELPALAREAGAGAVYFYRDLTPYARRRDARVQRALAAAGVDARSFPDGYLVAPEDVLKADGTPYTVYTP